MANEDDKDDERQSRRISMELDGDKLVAKDPADPDPDLSFTCPGCGKVSDSEAGYCFACHDFTGGCQVCGRPRLVHLDQRLLFHSYEPPMSVDGHSPKVDVGQVSQAESVSAGGASAPTTDPFSKEALRTRMVDKWPVPDMRPITAYLVSEGHSPILYDRYEFRHAELVVQMTGDPERVVILKNRFFGAGTFRRDKTVDIIDRLPNPRLDAPSPDAVVAPLRDQLHRALLEATQLSEQVAEARRNVMRLSGEICHVEHKRVCALAALRELLDEFANDCPAHQASKFDPSCSACRAKNEENPYLPLIVAIAEKVKRVENG
jgi:hypothetical protein